MTGPVLRILLDAGRRRGLGGAAGAVAESLRGGQLARPGGADVPALLRPALRAVPRHGGNVSRDEYRDRIARFRPVLCLFKVLLFLDARSSSSSSAAVL